LRAGIENIAGSNQKALKLIATSNQDFLRRVGGSGCKKNRHNFLSRQVKCPRLGGHPTRLNKPIAGSNQKRSNLIAGSNNCGLEAKILLVAIKKR
jgi:hypothetical protein